MGKENEKQKTKKNIKKIFDKSFFNSDFSHTNSIFSQKMNCQIIFSIFFWGGEGEVELSNFDSDAIPPPKKTKNEKQKKNIKKKYLTNHFLTVTSHIQRLYFPKKINCQIFFLIFFFSFFVFRFFGGGRGC